MQMPERWKKVLKQLDAQREAAENSGLESASSAPPIDLSDRGIKDRMEALTTRLSAYAKEWLKTDPEVPDLILELQRKGKEGLELFRDRRDTVEDNHDAMDGLESIVRADGSRPSFLVSNNQIIPDSSWTDAQNWPSILAGSPLKEDLAAALECVARVDFTDLNGRTRQAGTGFLIGPDLLVTNNHVLGLFGDNDPDWTLTQPAWVDFGKEYPNGSPRRVRKISDIVFACPNKIMTFQPTVLDLVILRLEPAKTAADVPPYWLRGNRSTARFSGAAPVLVLGYPLDPGASGSLDGSASGSSFDRIFKSHLGYKRVAPGDLLPDLRLPNWSVAHDASTLGGNSGSAVLTHDAMFVATGLHYGGLEGRANYAIDIASALNCTSDRNQTLDSVLQQAGVLFA